MKKILISILFTLTLLLSTTSTVLAAPFDLTYSADSTKNYTFNQFIDSPTVFDFVAANLAGYEIEGLDGTKYNAQEINNRTMLGMNFVQAVASIKATAAVVTAEGSLLQTDIDAAQALITALPNGADKTALQDRLNIVIASMPVVPPAPSVTRDDVANTVSGMTTAMEYSLDGGVYVAYAAATFNAIDFSGNHSLLVRVAAEGNNPPSLDTTLIFTTNPVTLSSIAITTPATKTAYTVGDTLDLSGLVVTGTYSNATTMVETITAGDITGFNTSAPATSQTLTITVGTKTTTYNISIKAALSSIAITTPATKTIYSVGDALDLTGLVVTGTYSNATTKVETITAGSITGFNSSEPAASQTLTITVGTKTTTYNISIRAELSSIAITTPATKTTYGVGEVLNITGLVVTGTYVDNSTAVVPITTANITGFDSSAPVIGQTLTISVNGKTTTYNINILKVVLNKTTTSMLLGMSDTLTATVLPIDAPNKDVIWTVASGSNSATVNNGVVTGINLGIATVTATTVDGSIKAQCFVTVANEASILNNFNLGTMTYMPGLITQFGDAIGLNLPVYSRMNAAQQLQIQQLMIDTPFATLADIKNTFDQALVTITLDEIHYATVDTMGAALESVSIVMDLNLTSYDSLSLAEKEIVHGKLLIPVWFGTYYTSAAEVQAALDLAVSNAPEAVTALAVINDASVETLSNELVSNAALLGLSLDSYILYGDHTTINILLEAQLFTNSYDLQIAIEMILYDLTSLYIEPFNIAGMDTIGTVIADNAAALGLDLSIYDLLSPAEQEIVHGYLVSKPYFVSGYYSLAALHSAFNEAVANAPAAEIALGAINAATVDTIYDVLVSDAVLLGIDLSWYDPATMDAVLAAQDFTNTYDLQMAIYGW